MKTITIIAAILLVIFIAVFTKTSPSQKSFVSQTQNTQSPLTIAAMKQKSYPGSQIIIEETLPSGSNYDQHIVSYQPEGLKQYALLTIPQGPKPINGWPVILFNHGYIEPASYSTSQSYAVMVEPLASAGYIVFKPDYRGNGNSEGKPEQVYISPGYITDSMNALASIKKFPDGNPNKIGVFGHSMGGNITLHELVITNDFKAAAIVSGVVSDETGILNWWQQRIANHTITNNDLDTAAVVQQFIKDHGTPQTNPIFWNAIDPTQFIGGISTPVQIQVGLADTDVPPQFSSLLRDKLKSANKSVDYIEYPGADHNLAPNLSQTMSQTIDFFDKYLK